MKGYFAVFLISPIVCFSSHSNYEQEDLEEDDFFNEEMFTSSAYYDEVIEEDSLFFTDAFDLAYSDEFDEDSFPKEELAPPLATPEKVEKRLQQSKRSQRMDKGEGTRTKKKSQDARAHTNRPRVAHRDAKAQHRDGDQKVAKKGKE